MELELKGTQLSGYTLTMNTTIFSEETMETIVPDACPDILQILSTRAFLCVQSKEVRDGRAEVRGTICAQVLYVPDGESGVCHIEVNIPYSGGIDHNGIRSGSVLHVFPGVLSADTRVLNPRKVYIRTEIALNLSCYSVLHRTMFSHCDMYPELGVEQKKENVKYCTLKTIQNKLFSYSDDLSLMGSKPDMSELLSYYAFIPDVESRVIGNKLVFKGQTELSLLYRSVDNRLVTAEFELPFSQIMEVADVSEDSECDMDVVLTDISCKMDEEDPRVLSVAMNFMAQAVIRQSGNTEILSDLYSTAYHSSVEYLEEELCRSRTCELMRQDVREVVETPVPVKTVVDMAIAFGEIRQNREGRMICFTPDLRLTLLYQGEDGQYYSIAHRLQVAYQMEIAANQRCDARCHCIGERFMVPTAEGIEIRFPLELSCFIEEYLPIKMVERALIDEENSRDHTQRPSVVLRMTEMGEGIWDIAKAYLTTTAEIMEANDLEHGVIPGRMLLIPKKR